MKFIVVIFLGLVQLVFGQNMFPLPGFMKNPGACSFNGPQDGATLKGLNFVENYGANSCLSLQKYAPNRNPIVLQQCNWQRYPTSDQLFLIQNDVSGSGTMLLKPVRGPVTDSCVAPTFGQKLSAVQCMFKNADQSWRFIRVRPNIYQIQQNSSRNCLRAQSRVNEADINLVRCNAFDNMQLWRICTSK